MFLVTNQTATTSDVIDYIDCIAQILARFSHQPQAGTACVRSGVVEF